MLASRARRLRSALLGHLRRAYGEGVLPERAWHAGARHFAHAEPSNRSPTQPTEMLEEAPSDASKVVARFGGRRNRRPDYFRYRRVFVRNVPSSVTESDVSQWASAAGEVRRVELFCRNSKPIGSAAVSFGKPEHAERALECLHLSTLHEHVLVVQRDRVSRDAAWLKRRPTYAALPPHLLDGDEGEAARRRRLLVLHMPRTMDEEAVRSFCGRFVGGVRRVLIPPGMAMRSRCVVELDSAEGAERLARALDGIRLENARLVVLPIGAARDLRNELRRAYRFERGADAPAAAE